LTQNNPAASIQYRIAVGPHAGRKVLTLKLAAAAPTSSVPKPFTVARDGFSLNAAVAQQRTPIRKGAVLLSHRAGSHRSAWLRAARRQTPR